MRLEAIILACALSACNINYIKSDSLESKDNSLSAVSEVDDDYFEEHYFIQGNNVKIAKKEGCFTLELTYSNGMIKKYFADDDFKVRFLEIVRGKHVQLTDCTSSKIPIYYVCLIQENFNSWLSEIYAVKN